jgi:hypothetical protein
MVDFNKLLREKLGPEKYAQMERKKEYLAKEKKSHRDMSDDELIVTALHDWHNCSCTCDVGAATEYPEGTKRGHVNGYNKYDCVYEAALVFRLLPELIIRLMRDSDHFKHFVDQLAAGETIKCPMTNCTGYVELP